MTAVILILLLSITYIVGGFLGTVIDHRRIDVRKAK